MSDQPEEFADLAAQTDHNRIQFLQRNLELGFNLASLAETEHDLGHQDGAERSIAHATAGFATVQRFLSDPKHAEHIDEETRRRLTEDLERLRVRLDQLRESTRRQ